MYYIFFKDLTILNIEFLTYKFLDFMLAELEQDQDFR